MKSSNNLAVVVTFAISAGLAGMGCMAQSADDAMPGDDEAQAAPVEQTAAVGQEKTGEATEKCGFGGGFGLGGLGLGCGGFGLGGLGCGGFGLGGLGCGGFFPGFGGCFGGVGLPFGGVGCILPYGGLGLGCGGIGGWW
jgi:hypothetical protein